MRLRIGTIALALFAIAGCHKADDAPGKSAASASEPAEAFGELTVDQVAQKMDEAKAGKAALYVYDNNDKDVFTKGHLPGAKWVKFNDVQASDLPADKDATLVFYCHNEH